MADGRWQIVIVIVWRLRLRSGSGSCSGPGHPITKGRPDYRELEGWVWEWDVLGGDEREGVCMSVFPRLATR